VVVVAVKKLGHDAVTSVDLVWAKPRHAMTPTRGVPASPAARSAPMTSRSSEESAASMTTLRGAPLPLRRVPMATPARPAPPPIPYGVTAPVRVFAAGTVTNAARPGVLATGIPSMTDLTALARAIANESSFERAAKRLQIEACKLTRAAEALCVVFDWPRRAAWTIQGPIGNEQVKELVAQVAGSGHRSIIGNALLEPIGPAPSRAVLALRKPTGATFSHQEIAMISTLALGLAASIDRLINEARRL
jgi:hypothetical protein